MWRKYLALSTSAVLASTLLAFAIPAAAQEMSEAEVLKAYGDALGGDMLNNPLNVRWKTKGKDKKTKVVKASEIQGQYAYQVKVKKSHPNPWDVSINNPLVKGLRSGDAVQIMLWARASTPNEASGAGVVQVRLQLIAAPYTGVAESMVTLSENWQLHYVNGIAKQDYKAKDLVLAFNIGKVKQTVEFGQFYVLNKGQNVDLGALPTKSVDLN
ncbi:MAG: hypothetical protein COA69_06255 [Robiginitomaculum sp.]|nr:MAG: hypothetical protein COA69_06255 [Robiginitomaculum sp.]